MSQDVTAKMLKPDFDSEVSGLVHGYLFHEQRPPQPIASGEVCARYQALADDKAFIWLHLNLNHATAEKWLTSHFPVADFSSRRSAAARTPPALSDRGKSVRCA